MSTRLRTKGEVEAAISAAITKFEREFKGRGPDEVKTYILDDLILIRMKGVLIPTEEHLLGSEKGSVERELVKRFREALIEKGRPQVEAAIADLTGRKVISLYADISTEVDERVIVLTLDKRVKFTEQG